jgi:hypothetical protein
VQAEVPAASTTAAGKVELATDAEAVAGTSATLAVTPAALEAASWPESWDKWDISSSTFTAVVSTHTAFQSATFKVLNNGTSTAAGSSMLYAGWQVKKGQGPETPFDFSNRISLLFTTNRTANTSTGSIFRAWVGKQQTSLAVGDLALKGFGVRINGSGVLEIMAHDGTTLTTANTSYTPSTVSFACKVVSDGSGNVDCYVDDSLVGTTTGGPTGSGSSYCYNVGFEVQQASIVATAAKQNLSTIRVDLGLR